MDIVLVIHVLAAATWFGANVAQYVVTPRMARIGGAPAAEWMRSTVLMGTRLYTPSAIVALITGIVVAIDRDYSFGSFFITLGFVTVVIGAVLGIRVFGPFGTKAAEAYEAGDDAEVTRLTGRLRAFGAFDMALLTVTIASMVMQWGARF
jgi:hypothetical protein